MLTAAQVDALLRPIRPHRVLKAQGQSHVAAFDVIAHLTRVFGFGGWDKEIVSLDLVHERSTAPDPKNSKDQGRWWVTYRCHMRLIVRDPEGRVVASIEDAATGSAQNLPSPGDAHDFAVKNAVSYALKRCAKDLGDQFGLSLYNKGQTDGLVGMTLVRPEGEPAVDDVEEHAPVPLTMGNDETAEPEQETPEPAARPVAAARAPKPMEGPQTVTVDALKARGGAAGLSLIQLIREAQTIATKLHAPEPPNLTALIDDPALADVLAGVLALLDAREAA
jgi:hypothetical protein